MAISEDAITGLSFAAAVDTAAKGVAVLGAACLMTGIAYNVSFFLLSKPEWLFHLSVADNLTATLYALPFVSLATVLTAAYAFIQFSLEKIVVSAQQSKEAGVVRFALFIKFVTYAAFVFAVVWLFGLTWAWALLFLAAAGGGIVALGSKTLPFPIRLAIYALAATSFLMVCAVLVAVRAHRTGSFAAEVEVGERVGSSIVKGDIVRSLEAGVILSQSGAWVWIPKERILQIRERAADKR